ncbi:hypothetical protein [Mycetocola zhadangensis]|uniref:ESX secretion-associated protein EspG n=1 Tax=Mycetocola zhadangensis TaxID=1164595 RepID=A0A3L7J4C5_9MICO|nr:hypothetical protein [Mycetocola zhadangensis]RLQ85374.1 hypothetical protein D9V28_00300 [Mycetocola zhadangensis]
MSAPHTETRRTRILLSADEWHLLTSRIEAIRVPVEFVSEWGDTVAPAERQLREEAALASLQRRRLVNDKAVAGDPDLTENLRPALGAVLSLPQVATTVIDIAAWGPSRSVLQSLSVAGSFCLGLARTQQVQSENTETDATPRVLDENSVEITACGTSDLIDEALRSLDLVDNSPSTGSEAVCTVSLADASALVLAARTGNQDVVRESLRRVDLDPDNTTFAKLAATITGGFVLRMHDTLTGESWAPAWFFSDEGWIRLGVDIGTQPVTAHDLVESGRVSCRTVSKTAITADVTAALLTRMGY